MEAEKPWLLAFLRRMSVRPGAYLGSERVEALELFINAYTQARTDLGVPEFGSGEERMLVDFTQWLEERLGIHDTRGWWGLIARFDASDTNVRTFVHLFDEFLRTSVGDAQGLCQRSA